ncbi:MAG TPA: SDR family NAD(P)-dependent oxidoreductase [Terriglobales bacterium]
MNSRFADKSVLVAGGTGSLGRAITLAFLNEGANVAVTYQVEAELSALKNAAGQNAARLTAHSIDVTNQTAVNQLVEALVTQRGHLDVLVNAVGGYNGGLKLWETKPDVWDKMLALNLRAGYTLATAVAPVMIKQKSGSIVNVAAKAAFDHTAGSAAYAASKAAAVAAIDCLAEDLRGTGVRANSILPSIMDTEANRRAMPNADYAEWPKTADVASIILFLCTDDARLIHGASIPVYGNF